MSSLDGYSQFLLDLVPVASQPITISNRSTGKTTSIPAVSFPLAYLVVVTQEGVQYNIPNVLEFHCKNTINSAELPASQVTFVIGEDESPPNIGPMDEVYIFAQYFDANIYDSAGMILSQTLQEVSFKDIQNRVTTGLVTRCHKIRENSKGKVYQIKFNTFMKKLYITSEFKQTDRLASDFFIGASYIPQLLMQDIGQIVKIAFDQSNMPWSYIYMTTGASLYGHSPSLSQDIITDPYGQLTGNRNFPLKTTIPFVQNIVDWQYSKWIQILNSLNEMSFTELFCNKYGQAYYRQGGMFRAAGDWDAVIDPSIVVSQDVSEGDETICTRLEVRWYPPGVNVQVPYVFQPPDAARLEQRYSGPRYDLIQAPWITFAASKLFNNNANNLQPSQLNTVLLQYQKDLATWTLANRNGAAVQGICQILGNTSFDVGMTVYFKPEDVVMYITETQDDFVVGKLWTQTLTLNYGRGREVDFQAYLARGVSILGEVFNDKPTDPGPISSNPTPTPIGAKPPNIVDRYNPFGPYNYRCTNPYGTGGFSNNDATGTHSGIDIVPVLSECQEAGPQNIYSVCNGSVSGLGTWAENPTGWGFYVCIRSSDDPRFVFCYCHLKDAPSYHLGDTVHIGDFLDIEGSTGRSTAAHLHFQVDLFEYTQGVVPTNVFSHTSNPWAFITPPHPVCAGSYPPDIFNTPVDNGQQWTASTFAGQTVWADSNYYNDVRAWATSILQGSDAIAPYSFNTRSFFVALSMCEIGDYNNVNFGGHFQGLWNFGNVTLSGKFEVYNGLVAAVVGYKNYFNGSVQRYTSLLNYLNHYFDNNGTFDPSQAALFLVRAGYTGKTDDQTYINKLVTAYNNVVGEGVVHA